MPPPVNGWPEKVGTILQKGGSAAAVCLALGLVVWQLVEARASSDPYTCAQATLRDQVVDGRFAGNEDRLARIEKSVEKLADSMNEHTAAALHPGSAAQLASMQADVRALTRIVERLERLMDAQRGNGNGGAPRDEVLLPQR